MNAIEFLIKEHNQVRKTLCEISDSHHRYDTKRKMFEELGEDLIRHESMEHKVWYPHFKANKQLNPTVRHLIDEENHAEKIIHRLLDSVNESNWEATFAKFRKEVEHHAYEEEHDLFPEVKKLLDKNELEKIGAQMYDFKSTYHH